MSSDYYKTIQEKSEGLFKDKGSRFLAFAFPVSSEDQVKPVVKDIKKKYHDARHHCYAYRLGPDGESFRAYDDGEPSGTAGKPILGQILSNGLSDILIVVVRYFGGTLLGTSGLINAYKNSAADAINNSAFVEKMVKQKIELVFSYELLSQAMRIIKDENLEVICQNLTENCQIIVSVRKSELSRIQEKFLAIFGIDVSILD
ncbi:MAG: YigZ family protein [Bacteroidales bacterium]|nr:YigZ family protein [Bacteroidales bacterium]